MVSDAGMSYLPPISWHHQYLQNSAVFNVYRIYIRLWVTVLIGVIPPPDLFQSLVWN